MSAPKKTNPRREIPAVEKVVQALGTLPLPRPAVVELVRRHLAQRRRTNRPTELGSVLVEVREAVDCLARARLQPLINATGVLIHTNLGRAPLGTAVMAAVANVAGHYSNLEFDLVSGERGGRATYLEHQLALLCRSQAATVVNNGAAALMLAVRFFTQRKKEVIISRGELVQIGGGFRIPEMLEASGARLREVGTTNRTEVEDYRAALSSETGLILSVHRSNFFMGGFVESPVLDQLVALAHKKRVPFLLDLGSGAVRSTGDWAGGAHEPTPAELLRHGVDLVCFSGDKLLGGPQAGILAGASRWINRLKRDPVFRAVRCDKLVLTALQTTVDLYLAGEESRGLPLIQMLETSLEHLRARAERILALLRDLPITGAVGSSQAQFGGGTLPKAALPSVTIDLQPREIGLVELAARLRQGTPPVVGYISGGRLRLDLRTVSPEQDEALVAVVRGASTSKGREAASA